MPAHAQPTTTIGWDAEISSKVHHYALLEKNTMSKTDLPIPALLPAKGNYEVADYHDGNVRDHCQ